MKKILMAIISVTSLLFAGCDLERKPFDSYTAEDIQGNPLIFDAMLVGCYGQLKAWSDVMHRVGEYAGDNIMIRGSSTDAFYSFISYAHTTNNSRLSTFWNNSYKIISQTSDLIKIIDEGASPELDETLGEAYYLRGTMYFYLCRVFGMPYYQSPETNPGVPIVNGMPADFENLQLPDRASVKQTYVQAIADLRKAERLMSNAQKTRIKASKGAARAMLSRIYLYMSGTYENPNILYADSAIHYANAVIDNNYFKMLNSENFKKYNEFAPENNEETIFAVKRISSEFSGSDHYYGIGGMYANIAGMGWGEMYASAKYIALLEKSGGGNKTNDARWNFIRPQYDGKGKKVFRFVKNTYDKDGVLAAYDYMQPVLDTAVNGELIVPYRFTYAYTRLVKDSDGKDKTDTVDRVTYNLTDTGDGIHYSVNGYENRVYSRANSSENQTLAYSVVENYAGEIDVLMRLNRVYPMFYIYKCSLQDGESHLHSPIISRLAEMYLNLAEAYAKKGDYDDALVNVNRIRSRAVAGGGYPTGYITSTNAAQLIDEERQLELAFEAHRSFDVYRIGKPLVRRYPGPHNAVEEIAPTDPRVVQYIPQSEINAYPGKLTQNP
jgi:tetratricopeptide (TPR) repeat protein